MRNEGMCHNVVNRAKMVGAKRVVVLAGANHRKPEFDDMRGFCLCFKPKMNQQ